MDNPKPKLNLSLRNETEEQRETQAEITPADIEEAKVFVNELSTPGEYHLKGAIRKIRPQELKQFWTPEDN